MSEDTKTRVALATEDLARARRLTEEAKSRLYEVSLIVGRALGRDFPAGSFVNFEQRRSEADQTIEVVVALPDGTFACYQDPPGICVHPC
jgi:hypothetical protein